jgi:hypothetical protein
MQNTEILQKLSLLKRIQRKNKSCR